MRPPFCEQALRTPIAYVPDTIPSRAGRAAHGEDYFVEALRQYEPITLPALAFKLKWTKDRVRSAAARAEAKGRIVRAGEVRSSCGGPRQPVWRAAA